MLSDIDMVEEQDDWLSMTPLSASASTNNADSQPSLPHIRLKIKYKHDVILPVKDYMDLQKVRKCLFVTTFVHLPYVVVASSFLLILNREDYSNFHRFLRTMMNKLFHR